MDPKVNYAVVGLFVILLSTAFVGVIVWLSTSSFEGEEYDTYRVYMKESVSGLNTNAPVKYRGVEVGSVSDITLDRNNPEVVRLTLKVKDGTPVKTDTRAILSAQGLTGIAFVDLAGSTRESAPLRARPGQRYPVIPTGPSLLARVDKALTGALDNLDRLTADVHSLFDPHNRAAIHNTLAHIESVTHMLSANNAALSSSIQDAAQVLHDGAAVSAELPRLMERINSGAVAIERMAGQLTEAGAGINTTLERSGREFEQFARQTLPEASLLISELRDLSGGLQRIVTELEREPSSLLLGNRVRAPGPGE